MGSGDREALEQWNLDESEIASVREVMVEAGAWQLIELTMDTADRLPDVELLDQARADIRAMLAADDARARAEALNSAADAIQAMHPGEVKNSVTFLRDRATRISQAEPAQSQNPTEGD